MKQSFSKHLPFKILFMLTVFLAAAAMLHAIEGPPADYVEDRAGIMDALTKSTLSARLKALNDKTGVQMIILTVPSTDGIPIEEYSIERAQGWGIGQKGKDNGILLTVAVNDKKYRIEVGYGLEPIIPDSMAGTIGREYMVPRFRQGDFSGGINDAANVLIGTIAKAYGTDIEGTAPYQPPKRTKKSGSASTFFILFIALMILSSFMSSTRRRVFRGRHGGLWIGGGGFGSGGGFGGGGFSGGGGSFGGGGASGGW